MKRLFTFLSATIMLLFAGCGEEYVDPNVLNRLDNLEDRLERLEELCLKLNTNIASLQTIITALQNNDYVTGVTPITKAGEVIGYTISFTKSSAITIYHGEDGKDGQDGQNGLNGQDGKDGKDGSTPVIGVRQDSDNIYYWTVNGEWLLDENGNKIKAEGKDGKDGENGQNGTNGTNGTNGENGKDGITPQLKIENDYWMISYDNGNSWTQLGKATGEKGEKGEQGDPTFQDITQDENNVYFTLNDGTTITIPLQQKLAITFSVSDPLLFDINETKNVKYTITGGSDKNVVKAELQNLDDGYTLRTTPTDSKSGTITITANIPTDNSVIVSVSDGAHTIMSAIKVSIKPKFEEGVITVTTPGTLASLLENYDKNSITELKVIGNLNNSDISTLNSLPALSILDMEDVNLETLKVYAFYANEILTSIKLPKTLKVIGFHSFCLCVNLTGELVLPQGLTSIGDNAFSGCNFTGELVLPQGLTSIGIYAFSDCKFSEIYCKATTPPQLGGYAIKNPDKIYVPTASVEAYKSAEGWSLHASIITGYDFE